MPNHYQHLILPNSCITKKTQKNHLEKKLNQRRDMVKILCIPQFFGCNMPCRKWGFTTMSKCFFGHLASSTGSTLIRPNKVSEEFCFVEKTRNKFLGAEMGCYSQKIFPTNCSEGWLSPLGHNTALHCGDLAVVSSKTSIHEGLFAPDPKRKRAAFFA